MKPMKPQHKISKHLSLSVQCKLYLHLRLHETIFTLSKVSIMVRWWMGGVFNSWSWQMKAGTILTPGRARYSLVLTQDLSFIIIQVMNEEIYYLISKPSRIPLKVLPPTAVLKVPQSQIPNEKNELVCPYIMHPHSEKSRNRYRKLNISMKIEWLKPAVKNTSDDIFWHRRAM